MAATGSAYGRLLAFFPAMLRVIGSRYFSFATLYGLRIYWALGATLALAGMLLAALEASVAAGAFAGAVIEYAFGLGLLRLQPDAGGA